MVFFHNINQNVLFMMLVKINYERMDKCVKWEREKVPPFSTYFFLPMTTRFSEWLTVNSEISKNMPYNCCYMPYNYCFLKKMMFWPFTTVQTKWLRAAQSNSVIKNSAGPRKPVRYCPEDLMCQPVSMLVIAVISM